MAPNSEVTILKQIDLPEATIKLRSDGIVHVLYKKNTTLDLELQLRMRNLFNELTNNRKSKFIFAAEEGFSISKEARENAPLLQQQSPILFYAIIANNLAYKIIANFYFKVFKPKGNHKPFKNIEDAVAWLNSI